MLRSAMNPNCRGPVVRTRQLPITLLLRRARVISAPAQTSPDPPSASPKSGATSSVVPTLYSADQEITIERFINMTDEELRAQPDIKVIPQIVDIDKVQKENNPFDITYGQVLLFLLLAPVALWLFYKGLIFAGVPETLAIIGMNVGVVLGGTGVWAFTYVARVYTKSTTYSKQLQIYDDKVMQKRLEEMTPIDLRDFLKRVYDKQSAMSEEEKAAMARGATVDWPLAMLIVGATLGGLVVLFNMEQDADLQRQRKAMPMKMLSQQERAEFQRTLLEAEKYTQEKYAPPTQAELEKLAEE